MLSLFQRGSSAESPPAVPFNILCRDHSELAEMVADERVMAVIRYGSITRLNVEDSRLVTVGLPELGGSGTLEVWRSRQPVQVASLGDVRFACNDRVMLGHLLVNEADYPDLDVATYAAYCRMLSFVRTQDYPYLLRVWNYFPDIKREQHGLTRYKAFCQGRYLVWERHAGSDAGRPAAPLPAACTVGTCSPGFLILFLAARQPATALKNLRQPGYSRQTIGSRPAPFSRAILKSWGARHDLYVSSTAGIVGHDTLHTYDPCIQLEETLNDLEALITNAATQLNRPLGFTLLKIYLRDEANLDRLRERVTERFGRGVPVLFLQGGICRSSLLIEIEATCSS